MTNDIFVGNNVRVSVNPLIVEIPGYNDPGYVSTDKLAAFPVIGFRKEVQTLEDYRTDFTTKLSGDVTINDTSISLFEDSSDPVYQLLDEALMEKKLLRFRSLYVIDGETKKDNDAGLYHIFNAYVTKKETTGSENSVVTTTFNLSPDGQLFTGFAEFSVPLNVGDYGIGAGTEEIAGVKDLGLLTGNRWVTVDATNSDNPYNSGTSAMAIQHPDGQGWELIGSSVGNPSIRIRNKQQSGETVTESPWVKVYTELERPTPEDINALPITGGELKGSLTIQEYLNVRKKISAPQGEILALNSNEINSTSVKVKDKEVYSPSNKPTPLEINCVALGETLDAGVF
ncbi:hypothetical protein I5393_03900 [Citrobacter freundii]|nr:hypothetical protein [Citrobacter freundii]MBJ8767533.1 hypothetical protein [Citrobacter freundii]